MRWPCGRAAGAARQAKGKESAHGRGVVDGGRGAGVPGAVRILLVGAAERRGRGGRGAPRTRPRAVSGAAVFPSGGRGLPEPGRMAFRGGRAGGRARPRARGASGPQLPVLHGGAEPHLSLRVGVPHRRRHPVRPHDVRGARPVCGAWAGLRAQQPGARRPFGPRAAFFWRTFWARRRTAPRRGNRKAPQPCRRRGTRTAPLVPVPPAPGRAVAAPLAQAGAFLSAHVLVFAPVYLRTCARGRARRTTVPLPASPLPR